jgi:hypothetical protein
MRTSGYVHGDFRRAAKRLLTDLILGRSVHEIKLFDNINF